MSNQWILRHLVRHLEEQGIERASIEQYEARWNRLATHESLPCPLCYISNQNPKLREQPLAALNERGSFESLRCPKCKTTYLIPVPE